MRIISKKVLQDFWKNPLYRDAEQSLRSWYHITKNADLANPNDVKNEFRNASFVANNRIIFNIAGNKYRLVVVAKYNYRTLYVRFIGTHKQYDKIKTETI